MASVPAELNLDYKPNSYSVVFQKKIAEQQQPVQSQKIQEFLARLEEERNKIEAFKRELPLCMQLLNNAIECYKQQLEAWQTKQGMRPVLEEFMPLKNMSVNGDEEGGLNAPSEKPSWMLSSQLWSQPADAAVEKQLQPLPATKLEAEQAIEVSPRLALDAKQRNGGAFLPFSKDKNKSGARAPAAAAAPPRALPELALVSAEKVVEERKCVEAETGGVDGRRENGGGAEHCKGGGSNATESQSTPSPLAQRKARRCWSPDLHRRFVNALSILGGSQVATPKQIRELMKVDGLTNDEVKSHLQKYRLHTRRPAPAPQVAPSAPQLVVLGGIWVSPEYATSAGAPAIYGANPGPAHYCTATPIPQEFYSTVAQAPQHHNHHLLQHLKPPRAPAYKEMAVESPESEARSSGDRSDSMAEEEEEEEEGEEEENKESEGKAALAIKDEDKF